MYCSRCGDPIEPNETYCNKCGNYLGSFNNPRPIQPMINNVKLASNNSNIKKKIFIGIICGISILILIFVVLIATKNSSDKYYFDNDSHENENESEITQTMGTSSKKGKYSTSIIYDNKYSGITINKVDDAHKLIVKDSISQKNNCPSEIKKIENEIINKYGIIAVNLCEMDENFAKEIEKVIKKIYDEYPMARGYITNLSLANTTMSNNYIAAFMPVFIFASSKDSTFPWVIKTQILLNTSYFLNPEHLKVGITASTKSGHFPPNTTIYSPVAHEFGHYLSFLAMMNYYDINSILLINGNDERVFYDLYSDFQKGDFSLQMINEAYQNYKKDTNSTINIDDWRGTISKYALAKDNSGNYIYDETIAESFHDVYLNGNNAKDASKYIIQVLKSKLEG